MNQQITGNHTQVVNDGSSNGNRRGQQEQSDRDKVIKRIGKLAPSNTDHLGNEVRLILARSDARGLRFLRGHGVILAHLQRGDGDAVIGRLKYLQTGFQLREERTKLIPRAEGKRVQRLLL